MTNDQQKARVQIHSIDGPATLESIHEVTMEQAGKILTYIGLCKQWENGEANEPRPRTVGFLPKA